MYAWIKNFSWRSKLKITGKLALFINCVTLLLLQSSDSESISRDLTEEIGQRSPNDVCFINL